MWDIHRRVRRDALPARPFVVRIELTDVRGAAAQSFLLLRRSEVSLCAVNPGFPEELCVRADRRTLAGWWRGDLTVGQARASGLVVEGRREWVRAFPDWFERYLFAGVAPARTAPSADERRPGYSPKSRSHHFRPSPGVWPTGPMRRRMSSIGQPVSAASVAASRSARARSVSR